MIKKEHLSEMHIYYTYTHYILVHLFASRHFLKLLQGPADYLGPAPTFNVLLSDNFHFQTWIR